MKTSRLFSLLLVLAAATLPPLAFTGCQTADPPALRGRAVSETLDHPLPETAEAARAVLSANGYTVTKADDRRGLIEASTRITREHGGGFATQRHVRLRLRETAPNVTEASLLLSLVEERPDAFGVPAAHQTPVRDRAEYRRFFQQLRGRLGEETAR